MCSVAQTEDVPVSSSVDMSGSYVTERMIGSITKG